MSSDGLPPLSHAISSALVVSLLPGDNPLVSLRTGRVQRSGMPSVCLSRYMLRRRTISDWALSLQTAAQGDSDSNVLMTTSFIPVNRLQIASGQATHCPIRKPLRVAIMAILLAPAEP